MFTIREYMTAEVGCADARAAALCASFEAPYVAGDRVFALDEDGIKAVGLLGLTQGVVTVKGVFGAVDEAYRDLMVRALLNVCTFMPNVRIRVEEIDDYFAAFGFAEKEGGMEVRSDAIRFS